MIKKHCCNRAEAPTTPQRAFVFNERRGTRREVGRVRRMDYETSVAVLSPAQQHRARDGCPQGIRKHRQNRKKDGTGELKISRIKSPDIQCCITFIERLGMQKVSVFLR